MTLILKQSTAIDIRMGPFLDVGDGFTPETGVTIGASDEAEVLKANGAATVAMAGAFAAVTGCDGWYDYTVAAGDVDTVGEVVFVMQDDTVYLPVYVRGQVVEEAVYDAMYGASAAGPLQSTTAGRTLDVTAGGAAGIDWGNVENKTTANDLSGTDIQLCDTVTTLTGHTAQTGDSFARLGAPAGASVSADVAAVKVDTGTTLDGKIDDIQGATFDTATDSLEAIRNRGDAAWTTGGGGSNPVVLQNTTIATLASQTSFTLTAGSADDDAYNNALAVVTDSATSTQKAVGEVSDYAGGTKTVTLKADPAVFTMAVGDTIDIVAVSPTIADIETDTQDIQTQVGTAGAGLTAINLPNQTMDITGDITGNLSGSVGSVAGAVGSVTGAVGSVTAEVSADAVKISGSAAAADQLEAHALTAVPVTFSGGTTTTAVLVNVDGAAASSVDDFYNSRILVFNAGTLEHQVCEITDYVGSTTTATISAVTTAVTGSHTAIML